MSSDGRRLFPFFTVHEVVMAEAAQFRRTKQNYPCNLESAAPPPIVVCLLLIFQSISVLYLPHFFLSVHFLFFTFTVLLR